MPCRCLRGNVFALQNLIVLVLGLAAFITEVFAFIDALRHRSDAYVAAGKLTKQLWLIILGVAMAIGFVVFWNPLGFIGIIAFVAAAVYLADVRPALQSARGAAARAARTWVPTALVSRARPTHPRPAVTELLDGPTGPIEVLRTGSGRAGHRLRARPRELDRADPPVRLRA